MLVSTCTVYKDGSKDKNYVLFTGTQSTETKDDIMKKHCDGTIQQSGPTISEPESNPLYQ